MTNLQEFSGSKLYLQIPFSKKQKPIQGKPSKSIGWFLHMQLLTGKCFKQDLVLVSLLSNFDLT